MPTPQKDETENHFVSRCISLVVTNEGKNRDQAIAQCNGIWANRNKESQMNDKFVTSISVKEAFSEAEFDEDNNMIKNIVLLASVSKNGRTYKENAMRNAIPMYEGVQLFVNHPSAEEERTGRRDVRDLAGQAINARFTEGKIKADANLLPDVSGNKFLQIAKLMPEAAGMSHNALGRHVVEDGKTFIEEITQVFSVDLVSRPATTKGMFESENDNINSESNKMEYEKIDMTELRLRRKDIVEILTKEGVDSRNAEFEKLTKENTGLKTKVDENEVKEQQIEKTVLVDKLLDESKLSDNAKTDVFKTMLLDLDEEKMKEAIEDRIKAIDPKSPVKGMGGHKKTGESEEADLSTEDGVNILKS